VGDAIGLTVSETGDAIRRRVGPDDDPEDRPGGDATAA
jgi:hypothetical protein